VKKSKRVQPGTKAICLRMCYGVRYRIILWFSKHTLVGWNPTIQECNTIVFYYSSIFLAIIFNYFYFYFYFFISEVQVKKQILEILALSKDLAMSTSEMTRTLGSNKV
jgi:hypothetical protein